MNRKLALLVTWVIVVICIIVQVTVSAEISVGVKTGDWIEYNYDWTDTPPPPYPTWLKIEILSVQGTNVTFNGTQIGSDGTQETVPWTVDLEAGQLGDGFIIPANLNNGDTFYEIAVGNITISGIEERTYAGARRTVVYTTAFPDIYWDKATGVLVEASYSAAGYTMNIKANKTNMWQAEFWLPIDPTLFYVLIIVAIAIVATVAFFIIRRRKKPGEEIVSPPQT